eukprot:gene9810-11623_t
MCALYQRELLVFLLVLPSAVADVYMNSPRGSNNKLNEPRNNAQNQNRLFDSQNNAAGGYQVGDKCEPVCSDANGQYDNTLPGAGEGIMYYYEKSQLTVEWTVQHACGAEEDGPKTHCELILQYMCNSEPDGRGDSDTAVLIRDGKTTATIPNTPEGAVDPQYGKHESRAYYQSCVARNRNNGLFTADQNVRSDRGATATRQNPNGNNGNNGRNGYECPEERDYYPYWHPTPWKDIAVITSDTTRCSSYKEDSENVKGRGQCLDPEHNTQAACEDAGATWEVSAGFDLDPPECVLARWSRDNHHGNGLDGYSLNYNWTLPEPPHADGTTCALRMRYNISTADYDAWDDVDSRYNDDRSPVKNNPEKDFVGGGTGVTGPLRLAINTAQYGRTFEDRSHAFRLLPRPEDVSSSAKIYNLNVRGRRGNIVQ